MSGEAGYAVVDVETTGLGRKDKVIQIGIVLLDDRFRVIDEYETLIDPCRDLGPTHVHGITPRMVSMAPCFPEVATAIARRIDGRTLVAHNLLFDERMLGQVFGLLDAMFDSGIGICMLRLTRQKLPMACKHFGIAPPKHHRALADAQACASLLRAISPTCGSAPLRIHNIFGAISVRTHRPCAGDDTVGFDRLLSRVIYDEGDIRVVQYMDLLDDLVLTAEKRQHLNLLVLLVGLGVVAAPARLVASALSKARSLETDSTGAGTLDSCEQQPYPPELQEAPCSDAAHATEDLLE